MRKTKIICTLGPATESAEVLRAMIAAGANIFRLNMSHATHDWVRVIVPRIRAVAREMNVIIGILMDTQGPAIRTGDLLVDAACQQLITRLLGLTPPTFAHLPALPGDDSMTVREQRDRGLHPEAVVGALAGALGIGSGAPATLDELIPHAAGLTG